MRKRLLMEGERTEFWGAPVLKEPIFAKDKLSIVN